MLVNEADSFEWSIKKTVHRINTGFGKVMNSIFVSARAFLRNSSLIEAEMNLRAKQPQKQPDEEIKSQQEGNLLQDNLTRFTEESVKMKKSLSEYDWKEEMEKIHEILQNRLNSLLGVKEPQISRPDESEYLFQRKQGTKDMLVFHITE